MSVLEVYTDTWKSVKEKIVAHLDNMLQSGAYTFSFTA